jgi:hypothetical protein
MRSGRSLFHVGKGAASRRLRLRLLHAAARSTSWRSAAARRGEATGSWQRGCGQSSARGGGGWAGWRRVLSRRGGIEDGGLLLYPILRGFMCEFRSPTKFRAHLGALLELIHYLNSQILE